jgi:RimJ/RimL family protein N-acetyltransferase
MKFIFDNLKLKRVRASVLERNETTLQYLLKLGWQLDTEPESPVRSHGDGALLVRRSISWTRDGVQTWLNSPLGRRIVQRMQSGER